MHVHANDAVISQSNSIAYNKSLPPIFEETMPRRISSFWTHHQGLSRHHQKPKPHICNNMKNVASFYYKFLRTHHARGACYHFGTGIPSVSKMQCTTQRVYSNRNLFKTLTSMNIALLMSPKGRNASRDGLVKLWEGGFYYLQYYYLVK